MWQAWINVIAGIWLIISAFWGNVNVPANYIILGIIVAIFGFWTPRGQWQGIVNGIIGVWLFISGFFIGLQVPANLWISGIIILILAIWRVYSVSSQKPTSA